LIWQYSLGTKIAIASTARLENINSVLWYHSQIYPELRHIFSCIVSAEDVEKGKPDPEVYKIAMERLGAENPDEVFVFEDTEVGITAAENAGIKSTCKVKNK